nr:replication factor A protein 1-like [Ipomoea batatas]
MATRGASSKLKKAAKKISSFKHVAPSPEDTTLLRRRYKPQGTSMTSTKEKTLQDLSNVLMHVVSIKDIYEKRKACEFWIGGKIVAVENSYNWFAVCCQANNCNSRRIPLPSGEYECKKCLTNWTKGIDKYNLKLQVEDANGNAKLKLMDKKTIGILSQKKETFTCQTRLTISTTSV